MLKLRRRAPESRRGAILVLVAILLPVLVILAAFAIDVAWMQLVRTELRTSTDAAARAAAKSLSLNQDLGAARRAARQAARRNRVAGQPLRLRNNDIQFGSSVQSQSTGRFQFVPGGQPINGVRVLGQRTGGSASGPVNLFFGGVLSQSTFEPTQTATSTVLDRDIALVIDRSGSMAASLTNSSFGSTCGPLSTNTRFFALVEAVKAFLAELEDTHPEERVALVSYSSRFRRSCPGRTLDFQVSSIERQLTPTYSEIGGRLDQFMAEGIGGATAIGEGLRSGFQALNNARPFAVKTIVLMTDGQHNSGVTPESVAQQAGSLDVTIHTITFSSGADQARMQRVAATGGGRHFHADNAVDLAIIFREIARTLPVLLTE